MWWYKTWQHSGHNHTHAKQKLLRKHRRACRSSWSRRGNQKSFTLTILWNLANACEDLSWNHRASTPHRSETNGTTERAVRRIKEGTSAVLLKSGLDKKWSVEPTECYCYLRKIQDLWSDWKTPYERRFGMPFNGPAVPFGAMIECHPISDRDLSRLHQFGPKVLPSTFSLDMRCTREKSGKET